MSYYNIANFRAGLDTRRDVLASVAGTLQTLVNCHINQGGEIEKRKAFVRTALPSGTFGLENTDAGFKTFGSADGTVGGASSIDTLLATASSTIGHTILYQRLRHPAELAGATYNGSFHLMTEVVASQNYQGKAFVLAKYADGRSFMYLDGVAILQSYAGIVLPGFANQLAINTMLANQIADQFDLHTGWRGIASSSSQWFYLSANGYTAQGTSPTTIAFAATFDNVSTAGIMQSLPLDTNIPAAYAGVASVASVVTIDNGAATYVVYSPVTPGGTDYALLCSVAVQGSAALTAAAIELAIDTYTSVHGFTCASAGATFTVTAPIPQTLVTETYNQGTGKLVLVAVGDSGNGSYNYANGSTKTPVFGDYHDIMVDHAWLVGDTYSITINTTVGAVAGDGYVFGRGNLNELTSAAVTNIFVERQRAFAANGKRFNFSALNDLTGWEDWNTGAGFVPFTSQYGVEDTAVAFATFTGYTAVLGRRSIQVWSTPADPTDFALVQTLNNTGIVAKLGLQSMGDADVIFLADTGFRSVRQMAITADAYVDDIGSPIDVLVQTALQAAGETIKAQACAGVEPTTGSFWCFLGGAAVGNGVIYVLTIYPGNKIAAWSTYAPTYNASGTQTYFRPQKFVIQSNQIFARDSGAIYAYGGSDNNTYDACQATVMTPFQSGGGGKDQPATNKLARGINVVFRQAWILSASTDWVSGTYEEVYSASQPSFDGGFIPFQSAGSHFSFKATTVAAERATLSSLIYHYDIAEEEA